MTDIANALPCPFCGSNDLRIVDWCDDRGDFDAVECNDCTGAAPLDTWNSRAETLVEEIEIQPLHLELIDG